MANTETTDPRVYTPHLDILEKKDAFLVLADVPGVTRDGLEINLDGDVLTLKAKVKAVETGGLPLIYSEYPVGDYETTLRLSESVDREKIEAEIHDGVLTLTLPKAEEIKPRQIKIKAA